MGLKWEILVQDGVGRLHMSRQQLEKFFVQVVPVFVNLFEKISITAPKHPKPTNVCSYAPLLCIIAIVFNWVCWGYQYI